MRLSVGSNKYINTRQVTEIFPFYYQQSTNTITNMSNNNFDVNGAATNFSKTCNYSELSNSKGEYKYNFACIPSNATNTNDAQCIRFAPEKMPNTFDCDYFFGGQWRNATEQQGLTCVGNCQGPPEAKAVGAGVTAYPSFALTFAALFMAFMMFKRN